MHKRVLLITSGEPTTNLGGPNRFVPMIAEAIYSSSFMSSIQLDVLMGKKLYKVPKFDYSRPQQDEVTKSLVKFKELFKPFFYSFYTPAKLRFDLMHSKQLKLYEKVIKCGNYNVVHSHDYLSTVLSSRICKQLSVPLIFTNHFKGSLYREAIAPTSPYFLTPKWEKYFRGIEEKAICVSDVLTFPSESARDLLIEDFQSLREIILKKSKIIYTGIPDPQNVQNKAKFEIDIKKHSTLQVVNIGNHIPDKGVDLAIHVFKKLIDLTNMDLYLVNFGQLTSETRKLSNLAEDLGIRERVMFKGVCSHNEVLNNIERAFLALHTPRKVVFDLSLLEIMALATPVFATNVKGNQEALGLSYPLFVVPERPEVSKDQITLLLEKRNAIKEMLRARYESKFVASKMVEDYVKMWVSL